MKLNQLDREKEVIL